MAFFGRILSSMDPKDDMTEWIGGMAPNFRVEITCLETVQLFQLFVGERRKDEISGGDIIY